MSTSKNLLIVLKKKGKRRVNYRLLNSIDCVSVDIKVHRMLSFKLKSTIRIYYSTENGFVSPAPLNQSNKPIPLNSFDLMQNLCM